MKTKTYRGELISETGEHLTIHAAEGGYVVRKPDGHTIGPVQFGGKVFKGSDFTHIKTTDIGYATFKTYKLKAA